jgi:hypothetical protein
MINWILKIIAWLIWIVIWIIIGTIWGFVFSVIIFLIGKGLEEEFPWSPSAITFWQAVLYFLGGLVLFKFGEFPFIVGYILGCFSFTKGLLFDVKPFLLKTFLHEE